MPTQKTTSGLEAPIALILMALAGCLMMAHSYFADLATFGLQGGLR